MRSNRDFRQRASPRRRLAVALLIATILHALFLIFLRIDLPGGETRPPRTAIEVTLLPDEQEIDRTAGDPRDENDVPRGPVIAPEPRETPDSDASNHSSGGMPQTGANLLHCGFQIVGGIN